MLQHGEHEDKINCPMLQHGEKEDKSQLPHASAWRSKNQLPHASAWGEGRLRPMPFDGPGHLDDWFVFLFIRYFLDIGFLSCKNYCKFYYIFRLYLV